MNELARKWIQQALDAFDERIRLPLDTPERYKAETQALDLSTCATELLKHSHE